jgi:hypothetical protein
MKLFDLEFMQTYPNNEPFAYMAAICDDKGITQLYIRQFNTICVHKGF